MKNPEVTPDHTDDAEQVYDTLDIKNRKVVLFRRGIHRHFGSRFVDHISGRPHKLGVWFAGMLTHLGSRRR